VISGATKDCQAAHIVAKCNFTPSDVQGNIFWDKQFPGCCFEPSHRVMDVRNGILLATWIHTAFDNYEFTICKKEDIFVVKTQTMTGLPELHQFDGKMLALPQDKRYAWPRGEFLHIHNLGFEQKKLDLMAAAEAVDLDDYDSGQTISERAQIAMRVKEWAKSVKPEFDIPTNSMDV
jgi:hypothetical protein